MSVETGPSGATRSRATLGSHLAAGVSVSLVFAGPAVASSLAADRATPAVTASAAHARPAEVLAAPAAAPDPAAEASLVKWIKEQSGLTWDQIAGALGVSRRTLHFWANGARVSADNAEALHAFAAVVRAAAGGSPAATRSALLATGDDGLSTVGRFRHEQFLQSGQINETFLSVVTLLGGPPDDVE